MHLLTLISCAEIWC